MQNILTKNNHLLSSYREYLKLGLAESLYISQRGAPRRRIELRFFIAESLERDADEKS